ncbi:MAG: hypothetical protein E7624_07480 [Ruminococcaceae bacterium]|nr:hypothetical protein [Oscillospiraceae bacterium]
MKRIFSLFLCLALCAGMLVLFGGCSSRVLNEYDAILTEYQNLLLKKKNGEEIPALDTEKYGNEADLAIMQVLHRLAERAEKTEMYGYAEPDLNADGQKELLLMQENYRVLALIGYRDGAPVLLVDCSDIKSDAVLDEKGNIYVETYGDGGLDVEYCTYRWGEDGTLQEGFRAFLDGDDRGPSTYYLYENGERKECTWEEMNAQYKAAYLQRPRGYMGNEYTLQYARLVYVPLFPEDVNAQFRIGPWERSGIIGGNGTAMVTESVTSALVKFTLCSETLTATAKEGGGYTFEGEAFSGELYVFARTICLFVTQSTLEELPARAYVYSK